MKTLNTTLSDMKNQHPDWIDIKKRNTAKIANFINLLDEAGKEHICKKWIEENSAEETLVEPSDCEQKLSWCMRDPNVGWEMILRILNAAGCKQCLSRLGAWHLEEWLAMHSEQVIVRVEKEASQNLSFKRLLSCVYQNSMSPAVFKKVKSAALYDGYFNDA